MRKSLYCLTLSLALPIAFAAAPPVPEEDPLPHGAAARFGSARWRMGTYVKALAYSPNGKYLATADGRMRTARLWESETGKVIHTFLGHRDDVVSVAFSQDGKHLLTGSYDKSARVWDVAQGVSLRTINLSANVQRGVFCADGKVVIVDESGQLTRFDAAGKLLGRFNVDKYHCTLSANGQRVAWMLRGNTKLRISDAEGNNALEIDTGRGFHPQLSPDGKRVAMRTSGAFKVWDATTGKEIFSLVSRSGNAVLELSADGKSLMYQSDLDKVIILDVATGKPLCELAGGNAISEARAFSPDGKRIALSTNDYDIRIFDAVKGTRLNPDTKTEARLRAIAFSPDSKTLLLSGLKEDGVSVWDIQTRKVVKHLPLGGPSFARWVRRLAISRDGKRLATIGLTHQVGVWDFESGKQLHQFTPSNKAGKLSMFGPTSKDVTFSANGDTLLASFSPGGVFRWDLKTGKELPALTSQRYSDIADIQLSTDGKTLIGHAKEGTVIWDVATGSELSSLELKALSRRMTSEGKKLVGLDPVGRVNFFDPTSGKLSHGWHSTVPAEFSLLRLSPDDKRLAVFTGRFLRIHEADGKLVRALVSELGNTLSLMEFSPDGKWLVVGDGSSVLLYEMEALARVPNYRLGKAYFHWCVEALGEEQLSATLDDAEGLLLAAGDTWIAAMRQWLTPPSIDARRAAALLKVATGDDEAAAKKALAELPSLGPGVRPALEEALALATDADVKLRLISARAQIPGTDLAAETRRALRLVALLQQIRSKEATALIADMANGKFGEICQKSAKR